MSLKTIAAQGRLGEGFVIEVDCGEHRLTIDQPRSAFGTDAGPTPLQMTLAAIAGCLGTIGRFVASQKKIDLRGMRFDIQADYDPAGLLGKDLKVRPGFQEVRLHVDIDAELSQVQKQEFLDEVERRCPLVDNFLHGTRLRSILSPG